jgi:hypothetical protein
LLVLACHAPRALEQFARRFDAESVSIHVHLDRKVDLDTYSAGRRWPPNLSFVEDRHEVFWGGFSMIRATEAAATAAMLEPGTSAFALVSDDTLPLRPVPEICSELLERPDRVDVAPSWKNPPYLRRYTEWFFLDSGATAVRPTELAGRSMSDGCLDAIARLARVRRRGKFPLTQVWGGSQWWSFGRETLGAILAELSGNQWLRESFEFAAIPDEQAFHTLYANRAGLTSRSFTSPMFADMAGHPAPAIYRSLEEVPPMPEGKLFLRKVDDASAEAVMAQIAARWEAQSHDA